MAHYTLIAANKLAEEDGIDVEVVDLRTLLPIDKVAILNSVKKTNKVLIAHEDSLSWGLGSEISARIADELFPWLDGPVRRVASLDTWVAYAPQLEEVILPQTRDVLEERVVSPEPPTWARRRGFADFLLRTEDPDAPLGWSYEVADTKLAHSVKAGALPRLEAASLPSRHLGLVTADAAANCSPSVLEALADAAEVKNARIALSLPTIHCSALPITSTLRKLRPVTPSTATVIKICFKIPCDPSGNRAAA